MICYQFKGGTGTASRRLPEAQGGYVVGVLVQANFGSRNQLLIAGAPVGAEIPESEPLSHHAGAFQEGGSIIGVVATDAPLLPHQLERLAKRAALGMARTGGMAGNSSGDFFIAFSTANPKASRPKGSIAQVAMLLNNEITPLFNATALATEEAIINALVAAQTLTGADGRAAYALPHDRLREVLAKYHRLPA
jgi:L-aminopeptidase/D-esterase-like protein